MEETSFKEVDLSTIESTSLKGRSDYRKVLTGFVAANIKLAEVTVEKVATLRSNLAMQAKYHNLPVRVFEKGGCMYLERTDKTKEELDDLRKIGALS